MSDEKLIFNAEGGRLLAEAALRSITASTARARSGDFLRSWCTTWPRCSTSPTSSPAA
jgi:hypothetical protein